MSNQQEQLDEIQARTRRTETMVFKLHEQMAGPREAPVEVLDEFTVEVKGYDVTLAQIKRALAKAGYCPDGGNIVYVQCGGEMLAELEFRG